MSVTKDQIHRCERTRLSVPAAVQTQSGPGNLKYSHLCLMVVEAEQTEGELLD